MPDEYCGMYSKCGSHAVKEESYVTNGGLFLHAVVMLNEGLNGGGPLVGCRLKFSNFVGSRLKFSIFVASRLNLSENLS